MSHHFDALTIAVLYFSSHFLIESLENTQITTMLSVKCLHLCFTYLLAIVPHVGQAKGMLEAGKLPAEMGLKHALLEHYDSTVRSTYNMSRPTDVSMELALQQIIDVVSKAIQYRYLMSSQSTGIVYAREIQ